MWILSAEARPGERLHLAEGLEFQVGRARGDIRCPTDASVSRHHAVVRTLPASGGTRPVVEIRDDNSTYGTYVGEAAIAATAASATPEEAIKAKGVNRTQEDTKIKFGFQTSIFDLKWEAIVSTTSSLKKSDRATLVSNLGRISTTARVISQWDNSLTHLVMTEVILTLKVVNALAKCVPIVTPNFFTDFIQCSQTKQFLPDPKNFVPPLSETSLNVSQISCKVNPQRRNLFRGHTFVFATQSQGERYAQAIADAGGRFVVAGSEAVDPTHEEVVVIKPPSEGSDSSPAFEALMAGLKAANLYAFPEQNIGVAILKARLDVDLNPRKKPTLKLSQKLESTQRTLASQTQTMTQSLLNPSLTSRVPATIFSPTPRTQVKNEEAEEDDDDLFAAPSTSSKRPLTRSSKPCPKSKRIKLESPSPQVEVSSDDDLFPTTPPPEKTAIPEDDEDDLASISSRVEACQTLKRLRAEPKVVASPEKRTRTEPSSTPRIGVKTVTRSQEIVPLLPPQDAQAQASRPKSPPRTEKPNPVSSPTPKGTNERRELSSPIPRKEQDFPPKENYPPCELKLNDSSKPTRDTTGNITMSDDGFYCKKKSQAQVSLVSVESSMSNLSMSWTRSILRPLFYSRPISFNESGAQDKGKNVKRFKKQSLASQAIRRNMIPLTCLSQTRPNLNDTFGESSLSQENEATINPPSIARYCNTSRNQGEPEANEFTSDEDEPTALAPRPPVVQGSQDGQLWDF